MQPDNGLVDILPAVELLIHPALEALRELGGTARKADVSKLVSEKLRLTDEQMELRYPSGSTLFGIRMNNVRLFLLKENLISQPRAGTWQLTEKGWSTEEFDVTNANLSGLHRRKRIAKRQSPATTSESQTQPESSQLISLDDLIAGHSNWHEQMLNALRMMPPERFERFLRLILQSSSLRQINVIRSDEGVCEGMAVAGGGLMAQTRVSFRCARTNRQLTSEDVSDFRREVSMSRALQGILIALGGFTNVAESEARRNTTPQLELINGDKLVHTMKELGLGLKSEIVRVERVVMDSDFFDTL